MQKINFRFSLIISCLSVICLSMSCGSGSAGSDDPDGDLDAEQPEMDGDEENTVIPGDGDEEQPPPVDGDVQEGQGDEDLERLEDDGVDPDGDDDGEMEQEFDCPSPTTWYMDQDHDGFGDPGQTMRACEAAGDYVIDNTDCEPEESTAYPASHYTEIPDDGIDQDCDGLDACRDINCDGYPDIVFAQTDNGSGTYAINSVVYFGSLNGYSDENKLEIPTFGALGVDTADLDRDGYIDLVFAAEQDGANYLVNSVVHYGSKYGVDLDRRVDLPTVGCADATLADVDKNGWVDIVFANRFRGGIPSSITYTNNSYVYWGGGAGFSTTRRLELETVGASRSWVGDLNADGFNEIVFANGAPELFGNTSYIYWGGAGGHGQANRTSYTSVASEGMLVYDIDKDDFLDLAFTTLSCLSCSYANRIYQGSEMGPLSWDYDKFDGLTGGMDLKAADLDGDNYTDLIVANGALNSIASYIYHGSESGFSIFDKTELPAIAASEVAISDLNGDGYTDIVLASSSAPDIGSEVSQIYWGSAGGYGTGDLTELPTLHAAGVKIVGYLMTAE